MTPVEQIRLQVETALAPGRFAVLDGLQLEWFGPVGESAYWELYLGQALNQSQTRLRREFTLWGIRSIPEQSESDEPLISVRFDSEEQSLHVCRAIRSWVHRVTPSASSVVETVEVQQWVRELVGSVALSTTMPDQVGPKLQALMGMAVHGTSRLPLTSVESPLPGFSLGQLGYLARAEGRWPVTGVDSLVGQVDDFRSLELLLRADSTAGHWTKLLGPKEAAWILASLKSIFLHVALTPYTGFVGRVIGLLRLMLETRQAAASDVAEFHSWLLELLGRHLGVYDLQIYHHRGANYPDALLLDAILRELSDLIELNPNLGAMPTVRRGLRMGYLLREQHRSWPVPDCPSSPGENRRVLPNMTRVDDEQFFDVRRRTKRLFVEEVGWGPTCRDVVAASLHDLTDSVEIQRLGEAIVVDRPFGRELPPGEPDTTPLLAWIAYSPTLARKRLTILGIGGDITPPKLPGIPVAPLGRTPRPGVVSIEDVLRIAPDFVLLSSTASSMRLLRRLAPEIGESAVMVASACREGGEKVLVYDSQYRELGELHAIGSGGLGFTKCASVAS